MNYLAEKIHDIARFFGMEPEAVSVNRCSSDLQGIPTKSWDWLASSVTADGTGYHFVLLSPAGGWLEITDDDRRRIAASVRSLQHVPLEELEETLNRRGKT